MRSIVRFAELIAFGAFCVFAGILLTRYLDWINTPEFESIIGAFLGSAFAVAGAAALWKVQERQAERRNGKAIAVICDVWLSMADKVADHGKIGIEVAKGRVAKVISILRRFDSRWHSLSSSQIENLIAIETTLENILAMCDENEKSFWQQGDGDVTDMIMELITEETTRLRSLVGEVAAN